MANSTLFRTGEQDPVVTRGHGTSALGPSDSTDSGSDIAGGPGLNDDQGLGFDQGTTSDADHDGPGANAGADTCSGHVVDRNALGFKDLDHADVSKPARKPAAQGQSDLRTRLEWIFHSAGVGSPAQLAAKCLEPFRDLIQFLQAR